ncbi:leucyl aminopeptidase family protein [Capnocytophaga catalasegens]|uniref:Cytosol aminopeptidase n=1 Tax=Capnocytophaga catalasegens TaxID=1004260 RepID=A0AAV5AVE3_9FLAO|nr:leucyl aminopeptidase [Capnocytophaga catalasegens]GIZ15125.1 putative cytosol aminopeptidase [Capnocytophaga catalasegens]GJM49640.1 putative cytosol aminopeptidase [Capnocytophaga catalasegens]GJM52705.1 putative cytosol aminopeptidase [Capnocytophaga catalasegens]
MKILTNKNNFNTTLFLTSQITELPEEIRPLCQKYFTTKENKVVYLPTEKSISIVVLALEIADNQAKIAEKLRVLGHEVLQLLQKEDITEAILQTTFPEDDILVFLEGMLLSEYTFDKYKTKQNSENKELTISINAISEENITELQNVISSVSIARTLVNEPVSYLNSVKFSQEIINLSEKFGFSVQVFNKKQIEDLKMGGLLGVNQGSEQPPTFNILTWKPDNAVNEKPYVFVGKGVVYDTGGYNIKTGAYMDEMKSDMAGGAAVVGTLCAIAQNKLPLYVVGLIPSTDNRISSNALVSDDILTMMNGLTVEIKNTDAEGRLILADALVYAERYNPELVIDLATLTGAAARVTSHYGSAVMGTATEGVKNELKKSGEATYERLIEFPFWDEFDEDIKSPIADIKNLGGAEGGASTAGKFLQRFTNYPWLHLDIAGTAFLNKPYKYFKVGGTGVGIRLLYHFLKKQC